MCADAQEHVLLLGVLESADTPQPFAISDARWLNQEFWRMTPLIEQLGGVIHDLRPRQSELLLRENKKSQLVDMCQDVLQHCGVPLITVSKKHNYLASGGNPDVYSVAAVFDNREDYMLFKLKNWNTARP